jgi:glycosyltransferase involved in cell wall biosynthesis
MNSPLVSVLTTVYNREKYLEACIESVIASTFQDWEMIIVDDQSNDNSVAIAQVYADQDMRIKFYLNEKNLGDYPNRNQAASYAKGKYLKFLDADDLIYPHGLEIMVQSMEEHPNCALGISQEVVEDVKPYPFVMEPEETFRREFLQRGVLGLGPTGTIIKRDAFKSVGGFSGTRYIGDTELWYQLAFKYPVLKIVPGLTFWRRHEDQEITKGQDSFFYLENAFKHEVLTLKHPNLPFDDIVRQGRFKTANRIRENCKISWLMVLKSI